LGYDTQANQEVCGVMNAEGDILLKQAYIPPSLCPQLFAEGFPLWSPDNSRYAVMFQGQLWVGSYNAGIPLPTGQLPDSGSSFQVKWLDNQNLLLLEKTGSHQLFLLNLQTSQQTLLGSFPSYYSDQNLQELVTSPDGTQVIIESGKDTSAYLLLRPDSQTTLQVELPSGSSNPREAIWSPDGSRFAFMVTTENGTAVILADRDGAVYKTIENAENPRWSPDNQRLLFECDLTTIKGEKRHDLCLASNEGELTQTIPHQQQQAMQYQWSPDGSEIRYWATTGKWLPTNFSVARGAWEIHRIDLESGEDTTIIRRNTSPTNVEFPPHPYDLWSPDGQWISIHANGEPQTVNMNGQQKKLMTPILCNLEGKCHGFTPENLAILGIDWLYPPVY
jgi:Tol biopolymer transport system component